MYEKYINKSFIIYKDDNKFLLNPIEYSRNNKLCIVDNKQKIDNDLIEHIVTITKINHDTKPEMKSKGVLFVSISHDSKTCPKCIKRAEEAKKLFKMEKLASNIDVLHSQSILLKSKIDVLLSKIDAINESKKAYLGKYNKHPADYLRFKNEKINLPTSVPENAQIGEIYWIHSENCYSHFISFNCMKVVGFEQVASGQYLSPDEMRYCTSYIKRPKLERVPNMEIPAEYAEKFNRLIEIAEYNKRISELHNKFNNNAHMLINKFNQQYDLKETYSKLRKLERRQFTIKVLIDSISKLKN